MAPPVLQYFRSHLFLKLPVPRKTFSGLTVIVTGANSGLGLEAARHIVGLDAARVILAVRDQQKGIAAKKSILESTGKAGSVVDVWELDLASRASVKAFAERAESLERLDVVLENAGLLTHDFDMVEGNERTITVNVINTFLLAFLLLPKIRSTSVELGKEVVLTFTGSLTHWLAGFPERNSPSILRALADRDKADMRQRYVLSKLLQLLAFRELSDAVSKSSKPGDVVVNMVNPGSVQTALDREDHGPRAWVWTAFVGIVGRTAEEGSRTLVHGAQGGREMHGQYLDDCKIAKTSDFVNSSAGADAQKRFWEELKAVLEEKEPGVTQNV
ncbi:putative short-chain dehydrogenase/reductase family protein [Xylariaceae sp. FL0594]|nr:putative short-chain dehydrogenase/reductase family protein [Xylariaceae sp. FL0594]